MARRHIDRLLQLVGHQDVLRLAAHIRVGLGASSFEWLKRNLTVLCVKFRRRLYLAMVPHEIMEHDGYEFFIVKVPIS